MDNVNETLDQQRWLLNNGLFTDAVKDNLYLFGAVVHKDVVSLETVVDMNAKTIQYILYVKPSLIRYLYKYDKLLKSQSIFNMWRLKRLLKRQGNLNLLGMLDGFVKTLCGPAWQAKIDIKKDSEYVDEPPVPSNNGDDKQPSQ